MATYVSMGYFAIFVIPAKNPLGMAAPSGSLILPKAGPFTEEVANFWDNDGMPVSAFMTGTNDRDAARCIVRNCSYDISACLDHCHIIPRNDYETVSTPSSSLSASLTFLLVGASPTAKLYSKNTEDAAQLSSQWSLDVQVPSCTF